MSTMPEKAALGDGEVFVRRHENGVLKAVKTTIKLNYKEHLYTVNGKAAINADGYDQLNKIASISVIAPETIQHPTAGQVLNPHIEKDKWGTVKSVTCRMLGIGRAPIGNWVVTDHTIEYNLQNYLIRDVLSMTRNDRDLSRRTRWSQVSEEEKSTSMFLPEWFDPMNPDDATGLLVNMKAGKYNSLMDAHHRRVNFAERNARTIAGRNCLKRHPAIGKTSVNVQNGEALVEVFGFIDDKSADGLRLMAQKVAYGRNAGDDVEVQEAVYNMGDEEDAIAADISSSVDSVAESGGTGFEEDAVIIEAEASVGLTEEVTLATKIRDLIDKVGKEKYTKVFVTNFSHIEEKDLGKWEKVDLQKFIILLEREVTK